MSRAQVSDFDRMVEELQRLVIEDARAHYSPQVIEEWYHPQNIGRMSEPDASAAVRGWCGDTMEIYLKVDNGMIAEVTFITDGCGPTVACGSMLTSMARGLPLDKAQQISPDDLLEALGGLPEESVHCAQLATSTLHEAIVGYRNEGGREHTEARGTSLVEVDTQERVALQAGDLLQQGYH